MGNMTGDECYAIKIAVLMMSCHLTRSAVDPYRTFGEKAQTPSIYDCFYDTTIRPSINMHNPKKPIKMGFLETYKILVARCVQRCSNDFRRILAENSLRFYILSLSDP